MKLRLNAQSSLPKYRQIIKSVEDALLDGKLKKGDKLPSLNTIKITHKVSRDTVLAAFNELKNRGIITSSVGRGYYISSEEVAIQQKVFVLFDELNAFKEDLYNSLVSELGQHVQVDVYFHHFNQSFFNKIIYENLGEYSNYVIMPAQLSKALVAIEALPKEKVFILDQLQPDLASYPAVYQNFEKNVFEGLYPLLDKIKSYQQLNLIFTEKKQPLGILHGFLQFCTTNAITYQVVDTFTEAIFQQHNAYFVLEDKPLIQIIKQMKLHNYQFIKDIGLIAYNDSMLKEVLEGGITTISTDFKQMGKRLAQMILQQERIQLSNPSTLILRKSI